MTMNAVWKYPLAVKRDQSISMPKHSKLMHVAVQHGGVYVWALVDPEMPAEPKLVCMYGTGHPVPKQPGPYIGTFMLNDGALVFHVFEG